MRVQSCVLPLSLVIFSNTVPCGKTIYLVDIVYGFRITQHIVLLSFPSPFPRFGGRAGGVVVHLSYFQTFNFLCEIIVNLFVQRILFFLFCFSPFGFSWRLFSKVELLGQRVHMVGLWLPGPRRGRCQCPGTGTWATALTREGQVPKGWLWSQGWRAGVCRTRV